MSDKVKKTLMISDEQDEELKEKAGEADVDQSFIARRALKFYFEKGIDMDKIYKKAKKGEL